MLRSMENNEKVSPASPPRAGGEEAIFDAALALPPEQRGAYLNQVCGKDAQLRGRIAPLIWFAA